MRRSQSRAVSSSTALSKKPPKKARKNRGENQLAAAGSFWGPSRPRVFDRRYSLKADRSGPLFSAPRHQVSIEAQRHAVRVIAAN